MTNRVLTSKDTAQFGGMHVEVKKNFYTWLWEIRYADGGNVWAGPYKTRQEARERLAQACEQ